MDSMREVGPNIWAWWRQKRASEGRQGGLFGAPRRGPSGGACPLGAQVPRCGALGPGLAARTLAADAHLVTCAARTSPGPCGMFGGDPPKGALGQGAVGGPAWMVAGHGVCGRDAGRLGGRLVALVAGWVDAWGVWGVWSLLGRQDGGSGHGTDVDALGAAPTGAPGEQRAPPGLPWTVSRRRMGHPYDV